MSPIGPSSSSASVELLAPPQPQVVGPASAKALRPGQLPRPATVHGEILWLYAIPMAIFHLIALTGFIPYLFDWRCILVCLVSVPIYGLGITLVYHRLLAHRSLKMPKWFERTMVLFAQCSLQDTPAKWVAIHRLHHLHPDEQPDPHSPLVSFFWSHVGWILYYNPGTRSTTTMQKYARDLLEDPFYMLLEKTWLSLYVYIAHGLLYLAVGIAIGWGTTGSYWKGLQFGLSLLIWGVIMRTIFVWHITWSVNSLTHMFGYRNYETDENSRNNWFVGIIALGEGWHNNHHSDPAGCTVWHRWWEFDITYCVVTMLRLVGLASDIVPPKHVRRAAQGRAVEKAPESPPATSA